MGSQFVDFNADGHVDYLSATFDGSPHISYGSKGGFNEPVRLKDAQGQRILISSYWDYDERAHLKTDRALSKGNAPAERCISALAFDWDGDGDNDLLLGSYEKGHLYRQMNEGTNQEPKFTGKNLAVMAGKQPFALPAKMTTPRLVDWDGDGDMDLVAGSFGDSFGQSSVGGGVYLSRNNGAKGKPAFGKLETLIAPSAKGMTAPTRPDAGLYPEVVDYDGDGDLDLVVGGYSLWTPKGRELNAKEKAKVTALRAQLAALTGRRSKLLRKISAEVTEATVGLDPKSKEWRAKVKPIRAKYRNENSAFGKERLAVSKQLKALVPGPQRRSFVWLYERL